jgi:ribosome modulation factor
MGDVSNPANAGKVGVSAQPAACPDGCDHSVAEHAAFDRGVRDGEAGRDDVPPYKRREMRDAWLAGHSVGVINAAPPPSVKP